ncbi:MAG: DivIVA domain-containing protein [Acidimicrobiales bacterium]
MAMGVSPQHLREVRFDEQWRGYRTDEVDELLEGAADALDLLEDRLRDASERAAHAEQRAQERSGEDVVSRTLVLAQGTADAAVGEAEVEASRLVPEAEERAQVRMAEIDARAARLETEIEARAELALHDLHERRRALEADVELLTGYVERQRAHLADDLRQHLAWLERSGHLEAAPVIQPLATPTGGLGAHPERSGPDLPAPLSGEHHGGGAEVAVVPPMASDRPRTHPLTEACDPEVADPAMPSAAVPSAAVPSAATPGSDPLHLSPSGEDVSGQPGPLELSAVVFPLAEVSNPNGADEAVDGVNDHGPQEPAVAVPVMADDDDPFIAELRRAVDDPEPLGPRDDVGAWDDGASRYNPEVSSGRRRRRRHR